MTNRRNFREEHFDDYDDGSDWEEYSDELDLESDDELDEPTIRCPECREEIHEESQCCPLCGTYISQADIQSQGRSPWIWIGAILCFLVVFFWILFV